MTATTDFITIARQRRIEALEALKSRENTLFDIADFRIKANRRTKTMPVFSSTRSEGVVLSLVEQEDRMAA